MKKGLFVTFEGIEGSGKTTQIKRLAEWLEERGYPVVLTREPGGTPLADRIRSMLLDPKNKGMPPSTELFLYEVARRDHVSEVIHPALREKKIVLCDRFTDATIAYQGFGRGLSVQNVAILNKIATGGLKPDRTFLLDLPVSKGLGRAQSRVRDLKKKGAASEDRFERERRDFHKQVREGYLTLARKEKKRFRIIHADRSPDAIFHDIRREMEKIL